MTASSGSCTWTATSNASWITITSGSNGTGNGTVSYSVSSNTDTSQRTGTMTIAGQTFTVTQSPIQEGIVFGFVIDEDSNPLKGVTVTITDNISSASTETDEDGDYEFSGLKAGDYTLTYKKDGYQTQTRSVILEEGEVKDLGTTVLEEEGELGKIYGYVVDIKGDPIESVRLKLKGLKTKLKRSESSDGDGFLSSLI